MSTTEPSKRPPRVEESSHVGALAVIADLCDFALSDAPRNASLWVSGCAAHAALAEFVAATVDYHEAFGVYDSAERTHGEESNCKEMREARKRCLAAVKRYRAAELAVLS